MPYSDLLPIKFYLDGETPFNDNKPFGVIKKKYYQKFELDSRIVYQISNVLELSYIMVITDEDGEEVKTINAVKELKNGVWFYSWDFSFTEQELPAGCYRLSIYSTQIDTDMTIVAPIGVVSFTGIVTAYVEIGGDMVVAALLGATDFEGTNYAFSSGNARLGDTPSSVCSAPVTVLYWAAGAFGAGVFVFNQKEFTDYPVGYNYISMDDGEIFQYDDSTGQVGAGTGVFC